MSHGIYDCWDAEKEEYPVGHQDDFEAYNLLLDRIEWWGTGLRKNSHFVQAYNDARTYFG